MIPAIASMIGAYIFTRMIELISRETAQKYTNNATVISATLTICVVVIALVVVWVNSREAAQLMDGLKVQ